jgi:hypothetical protein
MENCRPGKPCRRADNASPPAPNDKPADAKANQIFYHTLPCRATFLVVFEEDFFSPQHAPAQVSSQQALGKPARPNNQLAAKSAGTPATRRVLCS